ncbi:nucleoside hydrolase [Roseomonas sp. M0104]|uniref:Nucleoside hydrolase n=1 Tax=Teichococcus coralli TaxID=2545983 RepID=A0A845BB43_9PROT|nr:nucleoside hydrolase [Pseudoroseomonas coralli]MXP63370.1 nucleoside hydrolase [Pseudoroseomonas coralli]
MARKIIIDTDPGKDDAVAILLALGSPGELDVLSLVAVAGNVPLARTEGNARRLLELGGRPDIPVYSGCARPLVRPVVTAEHVHGETGLVGLVLPEPRAAAQALHGVDHLIEALRDAAPGEVTLCLLGPATNLAMALVKAPEIVRGIAEVVWMAGARSEGGNVTPASEYNVHADPEAAAVLLESGLKLTLLPLDLTHQLRMTAGRLERLRRIGTAAARAVATLFSAADGMPAFEREEEGAPLHDPCVIAFLLRPTLFAGRFVNVVVETASPLTAGMTVVDWFGTTDRPANANWLNEVADREGFFDLLFERLARLP